MPILRLFHTIKAKLLASVALFILLTATAISVNLWLEEWKNQVEEVAIRLSFINRKLQEADKLETLFFTDDANNTEFYVTGTSDNLTWRKEVINELLEALHYLEKHEKHGLIHANADIQHAIMRFRSYETSFDELVQQVKRRGFMDFGLEGEFRRQIHKIEYSKVPIDQGMVMNIRRYEKDFMLRKDLRYVVKMRKIIDGLRREINDMSNPKVKKDLSQALDNYQQKFTEYVWTEERIGLNAQLGLRGKLSIISDGLEAHIALINEQILNDVARIQQNIRLGSIGVMTLCLGFGAMMAFSILRWLGSPIERLSHSIRKVVSNNFSEETEFTLPNRNDEIGMLSEDFTRMLGKVHSSLGEVRAQSAEIERKQEQLMDSLRYAQQIQQAILPSDEEMKEAFADHFVLYKPQQMVSGDFYWLKSRENLHFFAVVDCTGHGVPGAFMSMIGNTLLNKLVVQSHFTDPSIILESLHHEVIAALRQYSGQRNNDGMDLSICCWGEEEGKIQFAFAGAKQNMLFIEPNKRLRRVSGVKRSVGGTVQRSKHKPFVTQRMELAPGTRVYFHTDGFPDQHNLEGKKFGSLKLAEMIDYISQMPMCEQQRYLETTLQRYKNGQHQRDDITVLGVQL